MLGKAGSTCQMCRSCDSFAWFEIVIMASQNSDKYGPLLSKSTLFFKVCVCVTEVKGCLL